MNLRYILNIVSLILKYMAIVMLVPCICAFIIKETNAWQPFAAASIIAFIISIIFKSDKEITDEIDNMTRAEALTIVMFTWVIISLLSAATFVYFGLSPIDALFESVSGITTTGATVLSDFSLYPKTMFFWRSFSQWLGGMGILVLFIAILPKFAVAGRQMFLAESPGASSTDSKLTPRIRQTAASLWVIYFALTLIEFIALLYFGMPVFDAVCTSLSTLSGGGLSNLSQGIIVYAQSKCLWVIALFMFLSGTNFALQYKVYVKRNFLALFKDDEFKSYVFIVLAFTIFIAVTLTTHHIYDFAKSLKEAFFQVVSIITTTGFASVDYNQWNLRAKLLLFLLMFTGASIGSAAGGVKLLRLVLIFKYLRRQIAKIHHPNGVYPIKINKVIVPEDIVRQIVSFVIFYYAIFGLSAVLIVYIEQNVIVGTSAAISTLGNVGPGFGVIGPMGNYGSLEFLSKCICIFNMLIGRLELIPFLALFHPDFWYLKRTIKNSKIKKAI